MRFVIDSLADYLHKNCLDRQAPEGFIPSCVDKLIESDVYEVSHTILHLLKSLAMPGGKYRDYDPNREIPRNEPSTDDRDLCHKLVQDAGRQNRWIFDPSAKAWFTPDEFQDKYDRCRSGFEDFFSQCQIRDPSDGVIAGMTRIQRMQDQLSGFVQKVITYYARK